MASFNDETANKLRTQVEFYFSDSNLPRDDFLNKEVRKSIDGLVSLALVCSFSRMRNLLGLGNMRRGDIPARIVDGVANLLRTSHFLKVSDDGQRIGRATKLSKPKEVLEQVHRRTIAASPFEYSTKMEDVSSFFSHYAKVNSVRLPHHIADKRLFSGTALVEFSSEQDTLDVLSRSLVYSGAHLVLIPKSDFDCQREDMIKKLGNPGPSLRDTSHKEFHRGQLLKFTLKKLVSGENVIKKENPNNRGKDDIAEKLGAKDRNKETRDSLADNSCASLRLGSGEKVDNNADQPPWNNSDSEVFKDVFHRFGSVKIEYSGGLDHGYVCFMDSETATKARAAVEFVGGLVVKKTFSVALEAVNGEMEIQVWKRLLSLSAEQ
uniref:La protein 2 n=2 Tax=Noccaea caerulescens TaxID=107243 RepID=A0A1J3EWW1_NOCCA